MIEFKHLRNFKVLVNERNYQRAAQRLNIAQPSLTRSIQRLEDLLGTELLIRGHQSMSLTASGELLLNHSDNILQSVDVLRQELHHLQGKKSGSLAIGTCPVPASTILGQSIGRYIDLYPNTHIEIEVGAWNEQLKKLLKGQLSLIITDVQAEDVGFEDIVKSVNLPSFEAVFCVRNGHPLAGKKSLTLAELRQYPLAIPRNLPSGVFEKFDDLLCQYRHDFAGLILYDTFAPIKRALQHSPMVALTPQIALLEDDSGNFLSVIKPEDMPQLDVYFSVLFLQNNNSIAISQFLNLLL